MHLHCKHNRRVVIVGPRHRVLHRADGSACEDNFPKIGKVIVDTTKSLGGWVVAIDQNGYERLIGV